MDMAAITGCLLRVPLGGLHSHGKDGDATRGNRNSHTSRCLWCELEIDSCASGRSGTIEPGGAVVSLAAQRARRSNHRRNLLRDACMCAWLVAALC
jgi:hypothetical protein